MNAFVLIDSTQRVVPMLRHGRSSYRRDDEDDDAATEVQTINSLCHKISRWSRMS